MKNLFNVSPFILLLVPVFVMMILTFTTNANHPDQATEIAAKATVSTTSLDKTTISISK